MLHTGKATVATAPPSENVTEDQQRSAQMAHFSSFSPTPFAFAPHSVIRSREGSSEGRHYKVEKPPLRRAPRCARANEKLISLN
jgi:hypothetical protein